MVQRGWHPTRHGECLDCYNLRSVGGGIFNHPHWGVITQYALCSSGT